MYRNILTNRDRYGDLIPDIGKQEGETMCNDERDMTYKESTRVHPEDNGNTVTISATKVESNTVKNVFDNEEDDDGKAINWVDLEPAPTNFIGRSTPERLVGDMPNFNDGHEFKSNILPDSGDRREFTTGSLRDTRTGKGRYDLISPIALKRLAKRLEDGMSKYGERNWEKGQPLMSFLDSAMRHIQDFVTDSLLNQESVEDHMGAALWNIHAFIHTKVMIDNKLLPEDLDDLPTPYKVFGCENV